MDLGGTQSRGDIQNACIKDHTFLNKSHAWILKESFIKNTFFTNCQFLDSVDRGHSFNGSTWESVTFQNCLFSTRLGSQSTDISEIKFEHVSFKDVKFVDCFFDTNVDVIFSKFAFQNVSFHSCRFNGRFIGQLGQLTDTIFEHSSFGLNSPRASLTTRHPGDMIFSQMTLSNLKLRANEGVTNHVTVAAADAANIDIANVSMGSFRCHRMDTTKASVLNQCSSQDQCADLGITPAFFKHTYIRNSTFHDGIECGDATLRDLYISHISVGKLVNFTGADINHIIAEEIQSNVATSSESNSEFSVALATLQNGKRMSNINTATISLAGASIIDPIQFISLNLSMENVNFKKTIFNQEQIESSCCTVGCFARQCFCNFTDALLCPEGNSSVWPAEEQNSCFPASAKLWTVDTSAQYSRQIRMDKFALAISQRVGLDNLQGACSFSDIVTLDHWRNFVIWLFAMRIIQLGRCVCHRAISFPFGKKE